MSLRSTCIEAMAAAIDVPGDQTDAAAALDALLGVLEEHADEWKLGAAEWWSRYPEEAPRPKLDDLAGLLAVLREDT